MASQTRSSFSSGKFRRVIRFCRQRPLGAIGGLILLIMVFTALTADWIAPYEPLVNDYKAMLSRPSMHHLMGTDAHGRDVLSRIIYGSRTALLVGFSSSFCGTMLGVIIGVICAYFGGKIDVIVQRFMEILLSFPLIVMALAMMAVLGTGILNVIVAITIPMIPRSAQVIRSCALSIRNTPYVDAARACGFGHIRIMFRHILPNVVAPFLILVTAYLGGAILTEASLSFLGVGVAEPTPAWGLMLKGAAVTFAETAPWMAIFPGLAISAAVFAFNIFGDSLRDELDPKLRTS
ncbi:MAG TPA: ABC transporter permease [Thermodesulfobacteriota bacterium]|nr:ABC transporter permease [Thermodesulfobacteriota bacterium]